MIQIKGIAASQGISFAKAYFFNNPKLEVLEKKIVNTSEELLKLDSAIELSRRELKLIKEKTSEMIGNDKANIFEAHLLILEDEEYIETVKTDIISKEINAEYALKETSDMFIHMFESMNNKYMKERASDIKDVSKRIIAHLLGVSLPNPSLINEKVIIVANDLTPSQVAQLNHKYIKGFVTNIGGKNSHSSIISRQLGIPAVVGTNNITSIIKNGDFLIVDGTAGIVEINPNNEILKKYKEKNEILKKEKENLYKLSLLKTETADNKKIILSSNIGTLKDLQEVKKNGSEGIGLYRTEFLYMTKGELPTEEEQFNIYKQILLNMKNKSVVVRTLDIGGDKRVPYLGYPNEMNPFLGCRAIRLCLKEKNIFKTQLRALIRASIYGKLCIMFPMISTLTELREAKKIFEEQKIILKKKGYKIAENIEIGAMIEVPSAAILSDFFSKEVDFISIGTNDLIQYTMAADRMNENVSYLYQPYNPAVFRLIDFIIKSAHNENKWVGICGEMASDPIAIPILVGMGIDELSMISTSILKVRKHIKKLKFSEMKNLSKKILMCRTSDEVISVVEKEIIK